MSVLAVIFRFTSLNVRNGGLGASERQRMGATGWYIFRTTFSAFLIALVTLTAIIWLTQALRHMELVTDQGQTLLLFLEVAGLMIPQLMMITGPVASMLAVVYVLNKLTTDSEIVAMSAAGMSPWRLFVAFFASTLPVSLLVLALAVYVAPECLRTMGRMLTEVRADAVSRMVQPGLFTKIDQGLTFHVHERQADGIMHGVVMDDRREPSERVTILAERGNVVKNETGTFLVLTNGSLQRLSASEKDPRIVNFDNYAFDLSQFQWHGERGQFSPQEQHLWGLLFPNQADPAYAKLEKLYQAELHDRLIAPVYPIAFLVILYAFLGPPRTARQSRILVLTAAVGLAVALRTVGFVSTIVGARFPMMLSLQYVALILTFVLGLRIIARAIVIEPPEIFSRPWIAPEGRPPRRGWMRLAGS
jgi:lipopolysaccharide export system permease protein